MPPEEQFGPNDAAVSRLADIVAPGLVLVTAKDANGTRQASGVCVRHSGEILTSTAVIGDATAVQVTTSAGDLVDATVLGRDDVTGLVLLNAERPFRAVPLSEVSGTPGDSVWIFGAVPPARDEPVDQQRHPLVDRRDRRREPGADDPRAPRDRRARHRLGLGRMRSSTGRVRSAASCWRRR